MSAIRCDQTLYKRHVFYLYPNALNSFGCDALTAFLKPQQLVLTVFSLEAQVKAELFSLLHKLDKALEQGQEPSYKALAIGLLIEDGKLSLDDKICELFPEKLDTEPDKYITTMIF